MATDQHKLSTIKAKLQAMQSVVAELVEEVDKRMPPPVEDKKI